MLEPNLYSSLTGKRLHDIRMEVATSTLGKGLFFSGYNIGDETRNAWAGLVERQISAVTRRVPLRTPLRGALPV